MRSWMLNLVDAMPAGSKCPGQAWRAAKSKIYCMAFVNTLNHIIDIPFFKPHPGCGVPVPVRVEIELSLHVLDLGSALLRKDRLNRRWFKQLHWHWMRVQKDQGQQHHPPHVRHLEPTSLTSDRRSSTWYLKKRQFAKGYKNFRGPSNEVAGMYVHVKTRYHGHGGVDFHRPMYLGGARHKTDDIDISNISSKRALCCRC